MPTGINKEFLQLYWLKDGIPTPIKGVPVTDPYEYVVYGQKEDGTIDCLWLTTDEKAAEEAVKAEREYSGKYSIYGYRRIKDADEKR